MCEFSCGLELLDIPLLDSFVFFSPPPQIGKDAERAGLMIRSWLKNNLRKMTWNASREAQLLNLLLRTIRSAFGRLYHLRDDCFKPIGSMYGIFTYIYHKNRPNVGKLSVRAHKCCTEVIN